MTKDLRSELANCPVQGVRVLATKASNAVIALKTLANHLELLDADLYPDPGNQPEQRPLLEEHLAQCEWLHSLGVLQGVVASVQAEKAYEQNHARLVGAVSDLQGWVNDLPAPDTPGLEYYPQNIGGLVAQLEELGEVFAKAVAEARGE